jgi:hypothetical protein
MGTISTRVNKLENDDPSIVEPIELNAATINLKVANTLGLDVPPSLLATADEVIE